MLFPVGVHDRQMEEAFLKCEASLDMPGSGEWIVVIVTAIHSATHFYLHLPCGLISPFAVETFRGMHIYILIPYSIGRDFSLM